jgi:hypothetical protein
MRRDAICAAECPIKIIAPKGDEPPRPVEGTEAFFGFSETRKIVNAKSGATD